VNKSGKIGNGATMNGTADASASSSQMTRSVAGLSSKEDIKAR
jgi:hypothetical protein